MTAPNAITYQEATRRRPIGARARKDTKVNFWVPDSVYATVLLVFCGHFALADDWPQFRGPNCTGISDSTLPLPVEFSAQKNVAWTAHVGDGVGSPTVVDGRVYVTGMVGGTTVALFAFDARNGKPIWQREWPTGRMADIHESNSHASTTPAADDHRVYFYFSTLGLMALDADTGEDVWRQKLPTPFFAFQWGPAMSPVLHNDQVIFCQDDDLFAGIYAFDSKSGELRWYDSRADMAVNYSHPVVCRGDRGDEIVVAGTGLLIGYDPDTGKRRWYARSLLRNIKTTPVSVGDTVYVSLQSGGIANQWLATADVTDIGNGDGKITREEMQASAEHTTIPESFFNKTFERGDLNGDGALEGAELDAAFLHPDNFAGARFDAADPADEYILAVRVGGDGDVTDTHVRWRHKTKNTDHVASPLVINGHMWLVKSGGINSVFETMTGASVGRTRRIGTAATYLASPIYGDNKIYLAGENGHVMVLEGTPVYAVLAKANDMGESIVATPAIADGSLFIRTRSRLFCIRDDG